MVRSEKVLSVVDDLKAGESLSYVSRKHNLAPAYVWQLKQRHCKRDWIMARAKRKLAEAEAEMGSAMEEMR